MVIEGCCEDQCVSECKEFQRLAYGVCSASVSILYSSSNLYRK